MKPAERPTGKFGVGTWLLWPKVLYFLLGSYTYLLYSPLYSQYLKERHFSGNNFYKYFLVILDDLSVAGFLGDVLLTVLADRTQRHVLILSIAAVISCASFCTLWMGEGWAKDASQYVRENFVLICLLLVKAFGRGLYPILDNRIITILSQRSIKSLYARQSLWAYVGYHATNTFMASSNAEMFGSARVFHAALLSTALFVGCAVALQWKYFQGLSNDDVDDATVLPQSKQHIDESDKAACYTTLSRNPLLRLFMTPRFIFLSLVFLVNGMARITSLMYFSRHYMKVLDDNVDAEASPFIVPYTVKFVVEISAFLICAPLIRRYGPERLLLFGLMVGMLRIGWYGFVSPDQEWAFLAPFIELLPEISGPLTLVAKTIIAHEIAPKGAETTAQGILLGLYYYLSGPFSGWLVKLITYFETEDSHALEISTLIVALFTLFSIRAYYSFIVKEKEKQ